MKISFNPFQIWANHIAQKQKNHEKVSSYIDGIVEVSEQLVDIWQEATINKDDNIEWPNDALNRLGKKYPCNGDYYFLLKHYYNGLSEVMGNEYNAEMEPLLFHISSLINGRDIARNELSNSLKNYGSMIVFEKNNERVDITSLKDIVSVMRKEALSLKANAKSFKIKKVSPNRGT